MLPSWKGCVCSCPSTGVRSRKVQPCRALCPSLPLSLFLALLPSHGSVSSRAWRQQNSNFAYISKKSQTHATICRGGVKRATLLFICCITHTTDPRVAWIPTSSLCLSPPPVFSSPGIFPKTKVLHPEDISKAVQFYDSPLMSPKQEVCVFSLILPLPPLLSLIFRAYVCDLETETHWSKVPTDPYAQWWTGTPKRCSNQKR